MPDGDQVPEEVSVRRGALRAYIQRYLDGRMPRRFVGQFLDEEGRTGHQHGLAGTCFVEFLKRSQEEDHAILQDARQTIRHALSRDRTEWTDDEHRLLKDVPRLPTKTVLLTLCRDLDDIAEQCVRTIFREGLIDGLLKPVIHPDVVRGDAIVTSYVLQILYISGTSRKHLTEIMAVIPALGRALREGGHSLYNRIYISNAICLYSYHEGIEQHKKLLEELYATDANWHLAYAVGSQFIDHWYRDPDENTPSNRFVYVPLGFVILLAIYLAVGSERRLFRFRPVSKLIAGISIPYDAHVSWQKHRASVYYIFFTEVGLIPAKWLNVPRVKRWGIWRNNVIYFWRDLNVYGIVLLLIGCIAGVASVYYAALLHTPEGKLVDLFQAAGLVLAAFLGLKETRRR